MNVFAPLVGGFAVGYISGSGKELPKPKNSPPDWVFGPVWTVLYLMMGYAANIVSKKNGSVPVIFWIQLALNYAWPFVYFKLKDPKKAFYVIQALWVSIILTIVEFRKADKFAANLLVPYLGWVTYATYLNSQLVVSQ
jgi:benzodiazapine receptor